MEVKRIQTARGYIQLIWMDSITGELRREYEHRLVWEEANGPLPSGWIIHHINGDKTDNRLENLQAFDKTNHAKEHGWKRWRRK